MKRSSIPFARPCPPRLSEALDALRAIEDSNQFSNFGPVNTSFELRMQQEVFGGSGACLTVCNATIGLMLAIREAVAEQPRRRYALMPSFTFAAAAQAALWNGLTPLFCDIDPVHWAADPRAERRALERYRDEIAVVVPYATFGYNIDLRWYETVQQTYGVPVVVDAAASLGSVCGDGQAFGTGFSGTVVFSMHATKSFATGEGGLLYSGDASRIERLRAMSNFGFEEPRSATTVGLNGKMSEVTALLATLCLEKLDAVSERRAQLVSCYRSLLPQLAFQPENGRRQSHQFTAALLPQSLAPLRSRIQADLQQQGVATATYFSPHVAQQPLFADAPQADDLRVTADVAARALSLPLFDNMTDAEVRQVCHAVQGAVESASRSLKREAPARPRQRGLAGLRMPALAEAAHAH